MKEGAFNPGPPPKSEEEKSEPAPKPAESFQQKALRKGREEETKLALLAERFPITPGPVKGSLMNEQVIVVDYATAAPDCKAGVAAEPSDAADDGWITPPEFIAIPLPSGKEWLKATLHAPVGFERIRATEESGVVALNKHAEELAQIRAKMPPPTPVHEAAKKYLRTPDQQLAFESMQRREQQDTLMQLQRTREAADILARQGYTYRYPEGWITPPPGDDFTEADARLEKVVRYALKAKVREVLRQLGIPKDIGDLPAVSSLLAVFDKVFDKE